MRIWRRINLILAGLVLVLGLGALVRLGFTYWSAKAVTPDKKVTKSIKRSTNSTLSELRLSDFHYFYTVDFLKRPTLLVRYKMHNGGKVSALPQYVMDNTVLLEQQTASGTTSVLAATEPLKGQLSFLNQNYQENAEILLKKGETAVVLSAYRLESRNRPVSLLVNNQPRTQIKPWKLKQVSADD